MSAVLAVSPLSIRLEAMLILLFGRLCYVDITCSCAVTLHLCLNGMSRQPWLTNNIHGIQSDSFPLGAEFSNVDTNVRWRIGKGGSNSFIVSFHKAF